MSFTKTNPTDSDIEILLLRKSISQHYVKRYIRFIFGCMEKNLQLTRKVYTERHHILPKANTFFPEYKNLKKNSWNKVRLTPEQHFVAHHILWKACGKFMAYAFTRMWDINSFQEGKRTIRRVNLHLYADAMRAAATYQSNRIITSQTRERMSMSQKQRKLMECPHCGKKCDPTNALRWHFDNCKTLTGKEKQDVKQNIQIGKCPHCGLEGKMQGLLATHFDKCRIIIGNRQKDTPNITCPHCGLTGQKGGAMNFFHFDNCPSFTGQKRLPHRSYDRTLGRCPHCGFVGTEHGLHSRHYDRCPSLRERQSQIQCPHCMKKGNDNNYFRSWHFDKCKNYQRQITVSNG